MGLALSVSRHREHRRQPQGHGRIPATLGRKRQAQVAARLAAACNEIRALRQDMQAGTALHLAERLAPIAQHVAQAAGANAELCDRQARHLTAGPEAEAAAGLSREAVS